jgi:hypothetical protein
MYEIYFSFIVLYLSVEQKESLINPFKRGEKMFISVTRMRLKGKRQLPRFFFHTLKSFLQVRKANGVLKILGDREDNLTYWTLTTWVDIDSMKKYRNSGAHLQAMKASKNIASELEFIHWSDDSLPSWQECKKRLHEKYK